MNWEKRGEGPVEVESMVLQGFNSQLLTEKLKEV